MLVPSMSDEEISKEIRNDFSTINHSSTLNRLSLEYVKERNRKKIPKEEMYPVFREIRTHSKNKWMVYLSKKTAPEKLKTKEDVGFLCITWYHSFKGIRVFACSKRKNLVVVFNGHLFTRYRERMHLPLTQTMDLVKHFFIKNQLGTYHIADMKEGHQKSIGMIREGYMMGEYISDKRWMVNKTFISKETASLKTGLMEKELVQSMEVNLAMLQGAENSDEYEDLVIFYRYMGLMDNNKFSPGLKEKIEDIHQGKGPVGGYHSIP